MRKLLFPAGPRLRLAEPEGVLPAVLRPCVRVRAFGVYSTLFERPVRFPFRRPPLLRRGGGGPGPLQAQGGNSLRAGGAAGPVGKVGKTTICI